MILSYFSKNKSVLNLKQKGDMSMARLIINKPTIQKILIDKKIIDKFNESMQDTLRNKKIIKDSLNIIIRPNADKKIMNTINKIKPNDDKTFDKIVAKKLKNPDFDFLFSFKKNNDNKLNGFQEYYSRILEVVRNQELEQEGKATLEAVKDTEFNYLTGDFGLAMSEMFKKAAALFKRQ